MSARLATALIAGLALPTLSTATSAVSAPNTVGVVVGLRSPAGEVAITGFSGATVRRIVPLSARVIAVPAAQVSATLRRLRRSGSVRYAEAETTLHTSEGEGALRGDPIRRDQWSLDAIGVPAAWTVTRGAGVTVAVVDTGVAAAPDLDGRILPGWNALTHTADATDDNGHGTHVAGTIAEVADNGIAGTGIAPEASILPVKVLDAAGSGSDATVADGIVWAVDHGAEVVNLSLGGSSRSSVIADAVAYAHTEGVLVVAAAGNRGEAVEYPARFPSVLAVGAVDSSLATAPFSGRGKGLDLVAPGVQIIQQTLGDRLGSWANRSLDGTSMATPHVAAAAALLIASGRATTPTAVANRLRRTAQDLGTPGWDTETGSGLVRVDRAVGAAVPEPGRPT